MTTIAGYTDGILDGTIPPERERHYLQIISDESRRLSRLVRRMLDISQIQSKEMKKEGEITTYTFTKVISGKTYQFIGNWQENKKTRGTFTLMFSEL